MNRALIEELIEQSLAITLSRLKPCPFCGGQAEVREETRPDPPASYGVYLVKCPRCGARTRDFINDGSYGEKHSISDAAEAWNRRAEE